MKALRRLFGTVPVAVGCAIALVACAGREQARRDDSIGHLPISAAGSVLTVRVQAGDVAPGRLMLIAHVRPLAPIERLRIDVDSRDAGLRIRPEECQLGDLEPAAGPAAGSGQPYSLALQVACEFELRGAADRGYRLRLRIRDARGVEMLPRIRFEVRLPGRRG
ncbi:MAG: hypothetical protein KGL34_07120 [Gammaproteobacteria bacterium]|nr:hypothetical protein [Gammaproteobacteria bacterium]